MGYPRIVNKAIRKLSPWVNVVEKKVIFEEGGQEEVYHGIDQNTYVAVLAIDKDGLIPIVRQYRPMIEAYTWEFPAGTVEEGEIPLESAQRELVEETGLTGGDWDNLGTMWPDTGRLVLSAHNFIAKNVEPKGGSFVPELETRKVTLIELKKMISNGSFCHQLHVALIGAAWSRGFDLLAL